MNGRELLEGLGGISPELYNEAEYDTLPTARRRLHRPFLAAALIAMLLLLTGCAVVYMLHMQDMKVGEQVETSPVFDENLEFQGYETIPQQVLTLAGVKGTPGYQAALEWFEFKKVYDQDQEILRAVWGNEPEFPAEYGAYRLYSQEMKDKLDGIMETYSLKPAGQRLEFRTVKNLCTALDVEKILTAANETTVQVKGGSAFENGNFGLSLGFALPEDGSDVTDTWGTLVWNRKDCFSDDTIAIEDTGDWQEWNYTTASGSQVLIIRSESDWRGWIICDRPQATMSLMVEARQDYGNNVDGKTWWDYLYMTDRQLEMIADAIDFGIQPRVATLEDVDNQEGISMESTQDGYTVKLKSVETDGVLARFTFGITAPEGTVISKQPDGSKFHILTTNMRNLIPLSGSTRGGSAPMNVQEDGDGLDNTQDVVIEAKEIMEDGSKPFAVGTKWNIRFEDLINLEGGGRLSGTTTVLAEGEWLFPITIEESFGDFREMELVPEPVTVKACIGWKADGTDVMEDVELRSLILRSLSASVDLSEKSADLFYTGSPDICVVMKDGTQAALSGRMTFESPIDVTQVDYVILPDGTRLNAE